MNSGRSASPTKAVRKQPSVLAFWRAPKDTGAATATAAAGTASSSQPRAPSSVSSSGGGSGSNNIPSSNDNVNNLSSSSFSAADPSSSTSTRVPTREQRDGLTPQYNQHRSRTPSASTTSHLHDSQASAAAAKSKTRRRTKKLLRELRRRDQRNGNITDESSPSRYSLPDNWSSDSEVEDEDETLRDASDRELHQMLESIRIHGHLGVGSSSPQTLRRGSKSLQGSPPADTRALRNAAMTSSQSHQQDGAADVPSPLLRNNSADSQELQQSFFDARDNGTGQPDSSEMDSDVEEAQPRMGRFRRMAKGLHESRSWLKLRSAGGPSVHSSTSPIAHKKDGSSANSVASDDKSAQRLRNPSQARSRTSTSTSTSQSPGAFSTSFLPSPPLTRPSTALVNDGSSREEGLPPAQPAPSAPLPLTPPSKLAAASSTHDSSPSSLLTGGSGFSTSDASDDLPPAAIVRPNVPPPVDTAAANEGVPVGTKVKVQAPESSSRRQAAAGGANAPAGKSSTSPTSPLSPTPASTGQKAFLGVPPALTLTPSSGAGTSTSPTFGPNGATRGRARGFTVGAVPSSAPLPGTRQGFIERFGSQKGPRPRSLLSHELIIPDFSEKLEAASLAESSPSVPSVTLADEESDNLDGADAASTSPSRQRETTVTNENSSQVEEQTVPNNSLAPATRTGRSRSGSTASLLQQVQHLKSPASFVIAVVGRRGSGKSTVIKKGLRPFGLSRPHILSEKVTSHSTFCIVNEEPRTIEVLEIETSVLLSGGPNKRFAWPKFLPHIDAVILCYDASDNNSFRGMSELLENFSVEKLSTVMLACKSEVLPKAVDPYYASDMAGVYNVGLAECTVRSEEGKKRMRDCFSYLVKEVAKARAGKTRKMPHISATNAAVAGAVPGLPNASPTLSDSSNGEFAAARRPSGSTGSHGPGSSASNSPNIGFAASNGTFAESAAYADFAAQAPAAVPSTTSHPQQGMNQTALGLQSAKSAGGYVTLEELWDKLFFAAVSGNDDRFLLMFMVFYRGFVRPIELLRELITRFDTLADGEYADGIMIRFSLMRLTALLGDWMQDYPGDLSGPETFPLLCDFFERLCRHPSTMHIAAPLQPFLEVVRDAPDLDAAWSKDQDSSKPKSVAADVPPLKPTPPVISSSPVVSTPAISLSKAPSQTHANAPDLSSSDSAMRSTRERSPSDASSRGGTSSAGESGVSASEQNNSPTSSPKATRVAAPSDETSRRGSYDTASPLTEASRPSEGGSLPASSSFGSVPESTSASHAGSAPEGANSSFGSSAGLGSAPAATLHQQKHLLRTASQLLEATDDEAIAAELTRVEWGLFLAIRPRDLLRHILVSRNVRSRDGPVARSIAHFNYISYWVCSMILIQGKTKHRARMMEKFMNIAAILRHDNNYNTLQAILAGLGNSAVHRLKQTRELLNSKPVNKTFQSLARLMCSDRSFAAYRLALENSENRTIPYLGVHLQDILSMSDGNPSKRASDNMVHWRKFSLMDESVMAIVRCQSWNQPPSQIPANVMVERLIFQLPLLDEEQRYERSLQVEPRIGANAGTITGNKILKMLNAA